MDKGRRALIGAGAISLTGGSLWLFGTSSSAARTGNFPVRLSDEQWQARLSKAEYSVLRKGRTERAGSSPLDREKRKGVFACAGCGNPLFASATKFDSGTGWPSFWKPLPSAVGVREDNSLFIERTEVHCARCGGHLGHVFNDGPKPTGLRYCMNGIAMRFRPA